MRHLSSRPTPGTIALLALLVAGCGGGDSAGDDPGEPAANGGSTSGGQGGKAGQAGAPAGGQAGASAGSGGSKAGSAGAVAGQGGKAGQSGAGMGGTTQGGAAGQGGKAGQGGAIAGSSGTGGASGSGQGGASGKAGAGASSGAGGSAGVGGSGQAGQGGTAGGAAAGSGGDAGTGGVSAGGQSGGQGGAGQPQGGAGGDAGQAGSGGGCQASVEVCNGLDDDCNGQIDNGNPGGGAECSVAGQVGECARGTEMCVKGQIGCIASTQATAEVCDGLDNDCDGVVDNGFGQQTCGVGACQVTVPNCDQGMTVVCTPLAPSAEICDGVDNNCDGTVDEGCNCIDGKTQSCYSGPAGTQGTGVCAGGTQTCKSGQWDTCVGEQVPSAEVCDGKDNDCNGMADDDLPVLTCGVGVCTNTTPSCLGGMPQTCTPLASSAEVCDGLDNNCDGTIDEGNVCCPKDLRCASLCCKMGDVCSFEACVTPGTTCVDTEDCPANSYCEYALGDKNTPPMQCQGSTQKTGKCLPKPPVCASGVDPGDPPTCLTKCEYVPPAPDFSPVLKYAWGGQTVSPFATDVMMTPIVVQLDDDDCDGKITARDIPEIVFTTFASGAYTANGTLHAISIIKGAVVQKWSVPGAVHAGKQLTSGDIDGKPGNEIVGCDASGKAKAFGGDGKLLWTSTAVGCGQPTIADLDQDGKPEVIIEGAILDGATGATKHAYSAPMLGTFAVTDLDGDGKLDIVTATQAYHGDGSRFVDTGVTGHAYSGCLSSYYFCSGPAVADLDRDGKPEVLAVYFNQHQLAVWQYDPSQPGNFKMIRPGIDINNTLNPTLCGGGIGSKSGGGPATVGDFNADGFPDVALAGGVGYAVFDGKKLMTPAVTNPGTFLWTKQTQDCSSAGTGSSLFDFNGDGKAEVIYADEVNLRIYEGATGNVLFQTCNTSGTLSEYPVIADVDNDGQADIVVASNAYALTCNGTKQSGIRIFGSATGSWVRTRPVWNEHAYHVTNVNDDGTIPAVEVTNWAQPGLNNFRQNKQPSGQFSASDLVVSLAPTCSGPYALVATVRNLGEASAPAGVAVGFYLGDPALGNKIGSGLTTQTLYPAEAEAVSLSLATPPNGAVTAVVDDGMPAHTWHECRTDNNRSVTVGPVCVQ